MAARQYARVVALSLALVPGSTPAFAQKAAFVDAFVAFHSALFGTYGDEGPEVTAALDRMASTLEAWDQTRDPAAARQFDAAIAATRSAIAAQPSRSDLHVRLGRLYEEVGRRSEATAAFEMARRISPSDPVAAYLLGLQLSEKAAADDADIGDALQRYWPRCWRRSTGLASRRSSRYSSSRSSTTCPRARACSPRPRTNAGLHCYYRAGSAKAWRRFALLPPRIR
jgi:tetratricopeptide (TPR) repeat protein